jgi:transformation/transcription domain-associated protein
LQELSDEVFNKVERLFLLGMRASDPLRRQRFFELYHAFIAHGLFERLQFIICAQDWQVRGFRGTITVCSTLYACACSTAY